ncbi:ArsB/NhaD family transporter [Stetteria hydrogenophila]
MNDLVVIAVFAATAAAIIARVVDETVAVLAGVAAMVVLAGYPPESAFHAVDWNVIMILLGMWLLAGYLAESGVPEYLVFWAARRTRSYKEFLMLISLIAGFLTLFLDNPFVVLLLGELVVEAAVRARRDPLPAAVLVAISANLFGTALLMGDLPAQILHSVTGVEFVDFIVFKGRPSSFPLLVVTFFVVILAYFKTALKDDDAALAVEVERPKLGPAAWVSIAGFAATVVGMALRPLLGYPLGFITLAGAAFTALVMESLRRAGARVPSFEAAVKHVEWRALMFYAGLFSLVGGLEHAGILERVARRLVPVLQGDPLEAYTVFYWVTGLLSMFIEHDALLLVFLYIARDAMQLTGVTHWGVYWGMAWSATLGGKATTAGAPALYLAILIAEAKRGRKASAREVLKLNTPYSLLALTTQFLISLPFWGAAVEPAA